MNMREPWSVLVSSLGNRPLPPIEEGEPEGTPRQMHLRRLQKLSAESKTQERRKRIIEIIAAAKEPISIQKISIALKLRKASGGLHKHMAFLRDSGMVTAEHSINKFKLPVIKYSAKENEK